MDGIAAKKGEFTLFALLMRADAPGTWDLVVSASWLESGNLKATREFVRLLAQSMGEESLHQFSRVVALDSNDAPARFILENLPVEDDELRVQSTDLLGLQIQEAIILRAKKPRPSPAALPNRALHPLAQKTRHG
ncbi:MAG: hypothetical protein NTZ98_21550 [Acidobacteria bacterium]|nr:hypothetical protein [Acidobacteriota bacterium]